MKKGIDFGKIVSRIMGNVNIEEVAVKLAPSLIPMVANQFPQLAQAGITADIIQSAMVQATQSPTGQENTADIPSGGCHRLVIEWFMSKRISDKDVLAAIYTILNDERFMDISEQVGDAIYFAIGVNKTIEHQNGK